MRTGSQVVLPFIASVLIGWVWLASAALAEQVRVPDLLGQAAKEAKRQLESAGLKAKLELGRPAPAAEQAYWVYAQNPGPDEKVTAGSPVTLRLFAPSQVAGAASSSAPTPATPTGQLKSRERGGSSDPAVAAELAAATEEADRQFFVEQLRSPEARKQLAPRRDGKPWDPNDPSHVAKLLEQVRDNQKSGRAALDGIFAKPVRGPAAREGAPRDGAALSQKEEYERDLRNLGDRHSAGYFDSPAYGKSMMSMAMTRFSIFVAKCASPLRDAVSILDGAKGQYPDLTRLAQVANRVATEADHAYEAGKDGAGAATAMSEARTAAEEAATMVCGYVSRAGTDGEIEQWKRRSRELIAQAQGKAEAAIARLAKVQAAAGRLRPLLGELESVRKAVATVTGTPLGESAYQRALARWATAMEFSKSAIDEAAIAKYYIDDFDKSIAKSQPKIDHIKKTYPKQWWLADLHAYSPAIAIDAREKLAKHEGELKTLQAEEARLRPLLELARAVDAALRQYDLEALQRQVDAALALVDNDLQRKASADAQAVAAAMSRARDCLTRIGSSGHAPAADDKSSPDSVKVPSLVGRKVQDATQAVRDARLSPAVDFGPGAQRGSAEQSEVRAQRPAAGTLVAAGSTVVIELAAGGPSAPGENPEYVEVPHVEGLPAAKAYALLAEKMLGASSQFLKEAAPPGKAGTVKSQNPKGGDRTRRGYAVEVQIYGRVVPSVVGWPVPTAVVTLSESQLSVSGVEFDRKPPHKEDAERVYRQTPPGGEPISGDLPGGVRLFVYSAADGGGDDPAANADGTTPATSPGATSTMPGAAPPTGPGGEGFLPGDGALIHPRFAAAQVGNGIVAEAVKDGDHFASSGERTDLHLLVHKSKENNESYAFWARRMAGVQDVRSFMQRQIRAQPVRENKEDKGYYFRHLNKKLTETEIHQEWAVFNAGSTTTQTPIPPIGYRGVSHGIVYRDVFVIGYSRTIYRQAEVTEDPGVDADQILDNAKKLIDQRFPKK